MGPSQHLASAPSSANACGQEFNLGAHGALCNADPSPYVESRALIVMIRQGGIGPSS